MSNLAIIHAGPAAESLKALVNALDSLGVREKYFMEDLIDTLSYDEEFSESLKVMTDELIHGQYFHHCLTAEFSLDFKDKSKDHASELLNVAAMMSTNVATYLHDTLVNQSRYDANGKFPYEYHSFDGKLIYLKPQ